MLDSILAKSPIWLFRMLSAPDSPGNSTVHIGKWESHIVPDSSKPTFAMVYRDLVIVRKPL